MVENSGGFLGFLQKVGQRLKEWEEEGRRIREEQERKKREEEERRIRERIERERERHRALIESFGIDPEDAIVLEGVSGRLIVGREKVVVDKGLSHKEFPIRRIREIEFHPSLSFLGLQSHGFIRFGGSGGRRKKPRTALDVVHDPNAVTFRAEQEKDFFAAMELIKRLRAEADASSKRKKNVADELSKLADLVERGFLTREEFEARKKELLGE